MKGKFSFAGGGGGVGGKKSGMKNNLMGKYIPYLVVFHPSSQVQLSGNGIQSNK